jgi:hypothetical protein
MPQEGGHTIHGAHQEVPQAKTHPGTFLEKWVGLDFFVFLISAVKDNNKRKRRNGSTQANSTSAPSFLEN